MLLFLSRNTKSFILISICWILVDLFLFFSSLLFFFLFSFIWIIAKFRSLTFKKNAKKLQWWCHFFLFYIIHDIENENFLEFLIFNHDLNLFTLNFWETIIKFVIINQNSQIMTIFLRVFKIPQVFISHTLFFCF